MNRLHLILIALVVTAASGSLHAADPLRVGLATVDITPPAGYRMSGYFSERFNTATHDPLLAKAMVLEQGDTRAAIVCCDLIGISKAVSSEARQKASQATGIPAANIVITATHSHTGPLYAGAMRNYFHRRAVEQHGSDPHEEVEYGGMLVAKLVECIEQAQRNAAESKLSAGSTEQLGLSFNRRFHMRDGTVRFNPGLQNPDIVRVAGPIDPEVGLLLVSNSDGKPVASLSAFALHLDTVGGTEYSADYPYYIAETLQQRFGAEFLSLFAAGTCGDINHIDVSQPARLKSREGTQMIGTTLGKTIAAALPKLDSQETALAARRTLVKVPLQQYDAERTAAARADMAKIGTREMSFLEQVETYKIVALAELKSETLDLEVQAFRLSGDAAIVTLPGEVFVELGLAIKQASPFKTTLVIELANDTPGYIPTQKAFAEGSYETVNSRIASGGAEKMVEAAIAMLKELD